MNANKTSKTNSKKITETRSVGRPTKKVVWPNGRFTVAQAIKANPHVCSLTVRKNINQDALKEKNSALVKLDELTKNQSTTGKGRKSFVYLRRAQRDAGRRLSNKSNTVVAVPMVTPESVQTPEVIQTPVTVTEAAIA